MNSELPWGDSYIIWSLFMYSVVPAGSVSACIILFLLLVSVMLTN